ncbi:ABC transporter ATP-binding protein [Natranaerobius thermophilus]|uniref:Oligopeptide/dipeptide ABC transporter, ATPase subunit n=1 Tax=Natranaerobius thermophilus (strain ATCC BAA-1301 / DSM 18059 / JW/NM-WN-LF) TaxID=457570 RepID=B2A2W7_NATTJ|nr:ABC transporter ATP-binding protein [Natranaerobius thermophilus]ACB86335.1 oligopeptide/dipeptide ABC transporter, ATPase subunit [Natranaerobius thermophilus JW/NM-WN-LF]
MKSDPILKVDNLKTVFQNDRGTVTAVQDVSFQINAGESVAIVGESGCGKSVTALSIMDLIDTGGRVDSGKIKYCGKNLVTMNHEQKRQLRGREIAMIFQEPLSSLNPVLTVGRQITEPLIVHQNLNKDQAKEMALKMLERVKIPRPEKVFKQYPHSLSGGMRQRVMIAIALICNPRLLVCDEPTTALDVTIEAQILKLLKQLGEEFGTSIMMITHDLGVVAELADKVIVMYAGQVVEESDVFSLFKNPMHPYTKGLLNSTPTIDSGELASIEGTVPTPDKMPDGCRFHPRCPEAMEICNEASPEMVENQGHKVRCFQHHEVCKKVAI